MEAYIQETYKDKDKTDYPSKLIEYLIKTNKHNLYDIYREPLKAKALDLGSGRGEYLLAFGTYGVTVEGYDRCLPDEEYKAYTFSLGNIEEPLPYKNNSFDIVWAKSVLEHLYYPEKLVEEVYRILNPGGCFLTLTPDWYSCKDIFYEDFTHRSPFTETSIEAIYNIHGFKKVKVQLIRQLPFTWYHPRLSFICNIAERFYNIHTTNKLIKFSKEKMILGIGVKKI